MTLTDDHWEALENERKLERTEPTMSERATEPERWTDEGLASRLEELAHFRSDFRRRYLREAARRLRRSAEPRCAGCGSTDVRIWGDDYCSFDCVDEHAAASTDAPTEERVDDPCENHPGRQAIGHTIDGVGLCRECAPSLEVEVYSALFDQEHVELTEREVRKLGVSICDRLRNAPAYNRADASPDRGGERVEEIKREFQEEASFIATNPMDNYQGEIVEHLMAEEISRLRARAEPAHEGER